jgi:hypothetical protein
MVSAWFPGTIARQISDGTEKTIYDNHLHRGKTPGFDLPTIFDFFYVLSPGNSKKQRVSAVMRLSREKRMSFSKPGKNPKMLRWSNFRQIRLDTSDAKGLQNQNRKVRLWSSGTAMANPCARDRPQSPCASVSYGPLLQPPLERMSLLKIDCGQRRGCATWHNEDQIPWS